MSKTSEPALTNENAPETPIAEQGPESEQKAPAAHAGRPVPPAGVAAAAPEDTPQEEQSREGSDRPLYLEVASLVVRAALFALKAFICVCIWLEFRIAIPMLANTFLLICFLVFIGHLTGILPRRPFVKLIKLIWKHMLSGVFNAVRSLKQQPLQSVAHLLAVASSAFSLLCMTVFVVLSLNGLLNTALALYSQSGILKDTATVFDWDFLRAYPTMPAFLVPQVLLVVSAAFSLFCFLRSRDAANSDSGSKVDLIEQIKHSDPLTQQNVKMLPAREVLTAVITPLVMFTALNALPIAHSIQLLLDLLGRVLSFVFGAGLVLLFFMALFRYYDRKDFDVDSENLMTIGDKIYNIRHDGSPTFLADIKDVKKGRVRLYEKNREFFNRSNWTRGRRIRMK